MERLPRGRHGLPREFIAQNQRERLLAALAACLEEKGYDRTTVSSVGKRAGVSKSDFYKQFESKDACFVAAYDDAVERIRAKVLAACAERKDWASGILAALSELLDLFAAETAQAQLVLVEGLRAGRGVYDRYQVALQSFVPYLRDGAPAQQGGSPPPPATDEAVVGGIASLLARRVLAGETKKLPGLLPEIAEFALTPYVGTAEARRIISGDE
ncbi:MAG TPA: TetR/AcrR family transcriptional regulator [Solirubrobacterales bacterium]|nr:TetR/AcrR family transcriptional regulator [Solirubrobacterales bacterium]